MPKHKENYYEVSKEQAKYMSSINTKKDDRFMVELQRMPSEAVNIENRVEACETIRTLVQGSDFLRTDTTASNRIYENLVYYQNGNHKLKSDFELENKTLILNRFFRSTERNYAAYENLCNGCGYGVFEARGRLCNFCQYVVHGAYERRQSSCREEHLSNGNIYENICDKCGTIYSSEECECCVFENQQEPIPNKSASIAEENLVSSVEILEKVRVKKKRDKKSLFYGLIGSLRRYKNHLTPPQTPTQNSPHTPKRLEIVHNVDGYDNVFRTQESFDLEKICELKRTQNSCSDQHIYGRLKQRTLTATESFTLPTTLSQSHDQLDQDRWTPIEAPKQIASADCISSIEQTEHKKSNNGKRPRISRPRLLRARSHNKERKSAINTNAAVTIPVAPAKQALYLADSVCQWMTSLRREIHNYQSFGLADDIAGCDPKSIPARNALTYGKIFTTDFKLGVTNCPIIGKNIEARETQNICEIPKPSDDNLNQESAYWDGNVTLRRSAIQLDLTRSPVARTRSQQMIQDFKRNLMSQHCEAVDAARSPTSTTTTTTTTSTPTTPTSTTMKTSPTSAQLRAKRQAIYLKLDDTLSNSSNEIANNNNNQNNNNNIHTDAKVNYTSEQLVVEAASQLASEHGLASRCLALQPIAAPSKRCGIYERDSEFVNDILSAFEQFLQRETDIKSDKSSAEVIAKRELSGDQPQTNIVEQSTACAKFVNLKSEASVSDVISVEVDHRILNQQAASVIVNDLQAQSECALNKQQVALPDHCNIVQPFVAVNQPVLEKNVRGAFEQIFNVSELIGNLLLSRCLNSVVIYYDKPLSAFLRCLRDRAEYREKYSGWAAERLVRKYQRFASYCQAASYVAITQQTQSTRLRITRKLKPVCESVEQDAELSINAVAATESEVKCCIETATKLKSVAPSVKYAEYQNNSVLSSIADIITDQTNINIECHNIKNSASVKDLNDLQECCSSQDNKSSLVYEQSEVSAKTSETEEHNKKPSKPRVPQRDPATCITQRSTNSPPRPIKRTSPIVRRRLNKMTVPTPNSNGTHTSNKDSQRNLDNSIIEEQEEDIYQPIWKFKTVGEVQERYHTDADYYEFDGGVGASAKQPLHDSSMNNQHPSILISNDVEDHGEWETDDEFMFTTQLEDCCPADAADTHSLNSSTVRSTRSGSSITGSTVTGYASSSMTIASAVSASLMHHLFRNIGIFYSLSEPKLRAIIYDYDRVFATSYFAKRQALTSASGGGFEIIPNDAVTAMQERSPVPPPRTTSASKTKASDLTQTKRNFPGGESGASGRTPTKLQLLPDSVQAWKFMLLDVNYLEDEEDMIVSESEILRAQENKDDIDTRQNHQLHFLQRFKSASIGNLIDIPTEEDKKSITERMRNKLQRGVFKLNVRSPKSEKKSRGLFRRAEATSLYLEDGMKPKYPIFGAPLDQLELNQTTQPNVPRFVVDCVEYIERKDCIDQDGLYRASGNKVSIDELKQKLSESYIYDPKLLVCDDIHTLTSLLKQFFRELGAPLIPQETYERLGRNLTDDAAIETMRVAFDEMREPNRSSLKFLIKHLTNVASYSSENRMPASNLAIVWGPCILSANQIEYDIARMNTLAKVLIENHDRIFSNNENERLVC